jgi:hypothetical protein
MRLVHIGQRKTGTTYLQAMLSAAERDGLLRHVHGEILKHLREVGAKKLTAERLGELVALFPKDRLVPAVVSYEALIAQPPEAAAAAIARVWPDAHILITTRGPAGYLVSSYKNIMRNGRTVMPDEFGANFTRLHIEKVHDLDRIVPAYRACFGEDSVTLLPFETLKADPGFYAREVGRLLSVDLSPYLDTPALNLSPPPRYLAMQREINELLRQKAPETFRSPVWRRFLRSASRAAALAPQAFEPVKKVDGEDNAAPVLPSLPEGSLERLAARMTILRDLPAYQSHLAAYGLVTPAEEAA